MSINVKTLLVRTTASQIANVNTKINNDFSSVETEISNLNKKWSGFATETTIQKFNSIKNTYYDNRHNVINNMVNFMLMQVGEGYEDTETANVSNATAFK